MDFGDLNDLQLDAIKEISNIGMGHAATALSVLMGTTVDLQVPSVHRLELSRVHDFVGGPELAVAGISLCMTGDARGILMLLFPDESARRLIEVMTGNRHDSLSSVDKYGASVLSEIGNILASAYLSAIGTLLEMTIFPSVPRISMDMAGAVLDSILCRQCQCGSMSLMVEAEFRDIVSGVNGRFYMMPDPETLSVIMQASGLKDA
jgi:chemotaxis protein CheC